MTAPITPAQPVAHSGLSIAAITVAVSSLAAIVAPALGLLLAFAGVWLALRCRRELRAHPELRGWGLSLMAMIVSSTVLLVSLVTLLAPLVMSVLFLLLG